MNGQKKFDASVCVLTAGRDRHYSLGLATALLAVGVNFDFIGGDESESPELLQSPQVNFLNLRGEQSAGANLLQKIWRVLRYYFRLLGYAAAAKPKIFHILWNNKFELFDRTLLMVYYKWLGKKIALTAHNVNIGKRDGCDSFLNRVSLKIQYRLCDRIFVHTVKMKDELVSDFGISDDKIVLIPFGLNNAVPDTDLTGAKARRRLGLRENKKIILFFGGIAPYKGLEFLTEAFSEAAKSDPLVRLIIAGAPKGSKNYWEHIRQKIARSRWHDYIIQKIEYISDTETEMYFKAADVLILPYNHIFQSGVLFLAYSFGLPVIATDVGSLRDEIVEGKTGLVVEPKNAAALAGAIQNYFKSDLYHQLEARRREIRDFANEKYSWSKVAAITTATYSELLHEEEFPSPLLEAEKKHEAFGLHSHPGLQR